MRLQLGHRGDYAVRSAVWLARRHGDGPVKAAEVAERMSIPDTYVARVLGDLVRAGLATSTSGPAGGYALTRPPAGISLLDVVEATEGELGNDRCVLRGGPCRWEERCAVHDVWAQAQQAVRDRLAAADLASVAATDAHLEAVDLGSGPTAPGAGAAR